MRVKLEIENKEAVIKWLDQIKRGSGDARPLWTAMVPKIAKEFVEDGQFSPRTNTGKGWKAITPGYKHWKSRHGFPTVIGMRTGKLRKATGKNAIRKVKKKELLWRVNESMTVEKGISYAGYFNKKRPVYKTVIPRVNSFLSFDIKKFEGGSHNSFTYRWLRNSLRAN